MDVTIDYQREISLPEKGSILLFGPRMVGKTTVLSKLEATKIYDLLDPELEIRLRHSPSTLLNELSELPSGSRVIIDEIQKIPELLDIVQKCIDKFKHDFLLSGSSARKLRRGSANLLGGRALDKKLYPLTRYEIKEDFCLNKALTLGTLPKITQLYSSNLEELAQEYLESYITTYIKEEIQAEAIVRNLNSFSRFLAIASQSHAQEIVFSNIAKESSTPSSTVKSYFQILEDTLIGFFLWPFDRSERKKARPKFYFFDEGVARALQNKIGLELTSKENGFHFESWFINELRRINEYQKKRIQFSFWRERKHEVDLLLSRGNKIFAGIELKTGNAQMAQSTKDAFQKKFGNIELIVVSDSYTDTDNKISYTSALEWFRRL